MVPVTRSAAEQLTVLFRNHTDNLPVKSLSPSVGTLLVSLPSPEKWIEITSTVARFSEQCSFYHIDLSFVLGSMAPIQLSPFLMNDFGPFIIGGVVILLILGRALPDIYAACRRGIAHLTQAMVRRAEQRVPAQFYNRVQPEEALPRTFQAQAIALAQKMRPGELIIGMGPGIHGKSTFFERLVPEALASRKSDIIILDINMFHKLQEGAPIEPQTFYSVMERALRKAAVHDEQLPNPEQSIDGLNYQEDPIEFVKRWSQLAGKTPVFVVSEITGWLCEDKGAAILCELFSQLDFGYQIMTLHMREKYGAFDRAIKYFGRDNIHFVPILETVAEVEILYQKIADQFPQLFEGGRQHDQAMAQYLFEQSGGRVTEVIQFMKVLSAWRGHSLFAKVSVQDLERACQVSLYPRASWPLEDVQDHVRGLLMMQALAWDSDLSLVQRSILGFLADSVEPQSIPPAICDDARQLQTLVDIGWIRQHDGDQYSIRGARLRHSIVQHRDWLDDLSTIPWEKETLEWGVR